MTFLNKTGVAPRLAAVNVLLALAGCGSSPTMNSSLNDYIDGEGSQWLATARSDAVCCIVALRYPLSLLPPFVGWYPAAFFSENQVPLNQSRLVSKPTGVYYNDREDYRYLPFDPVYWRQIDRQSLQFSCGKDRAD